MSLKKALLLAAALLFCGPAFAERKDEEGGGKNVKIAWQPGQKETAEIRLRRLADRLAQGMANLDGESRYQRFAVLKFEEIGERSGKKNLGVLVTSILARCFVGDHDLYLVERERLKDVLNEVVLGQAGVTKESDYVKAGELAGAEALVVGSVSDGGDHFLVSARVVSVKDGKTLLANDTTLPDGEVLQIAEDALVLRTKGEAAFRSALFPGWGQYYNKQYLKSGVIVGIEAAAAGGAVALHFLGERDRKSYEEGLRETLKYKESGERFFLARNVVIYSAVALWLFNVLDAYLGGYDIEDEKWASAGPPAPGSLGIRACGLDLRF